LGLGLQPVDAFQLLTKRMATYTSMLMCHHCFHQHIVSYFVIFC
jgi:hypothetical protein